MFIFFASTWETRTLSQYIFTEIGYVISQGNLDGCPHDINPMPKYLSLLLALMAYNPYHDLHHLRQTSSFKEDKDTASLSKNII